MEEAEEVVGEMEELDSLVEEVLCLEVERMEEVLTVSSLEEVEVVVLIWIELKLYLLWLAQFHLHYAELS